jgi:magnesium chelatase family protein
VFATIPSATVLGVRGVRVDVEVHVGNGLPGFSIVGLPDDACRESRDRVRSALMSSGLRFPNQRITVNLAPSSRRKGGSGLDVAIALGILVASEQLPASAVRGAACFGEVGLDGSIRAVPGAAPMAAALQGFNLVVAPDSWREAVAMSDRTVRVASTLGCLVAALVGDGPWDEPADTVEIGNEPAAPDFADVRGQPVARLGLEIAAAGGHHVLLVGPPGAGKTMLAQRMPGILPSLDQAASIDATMVHSAAGVRLPPSGVVTRPPFRAPHHSSSMVALVGGGSHNLTPGEISLADGGVLFLDELGEFAPAVLDALRQPLEEGVIHVARAAAKATLPARFLLVAATNPCPCGGGPPGSCECDETARARYIRRLSGPLLDRFDLRIGVCRPAVDELIAPAGTEECSTAIAERVARVRNEAVARQGCLNAAVPASQLDHVAPLDARARQLLRDELEAGRLTGRGYHRIRRVSRTVADLRGATDMPIAEADVALAIGLRVRLGIGRRDEAER